jgi:hypothetical protein
MPDLPLSGTPLDGFAVWVVMLRPREDPSPYLKRVAVAAQREAALALADSEDALPLLVPAQLLRAEPIDHWRFEMLRGCIGGAIAGDLLLTLLELHTHAPRYATIRRAHHIVMRNLAQMRLDGSKVPASAKTVWNAWRDFRPAAHLWGVMKAGSDLARCWPKTERLAPFLAYTEALAERAEAYGIAAPGELWRPAAVVLPPVTVTIGPPTEWALARAREYRAVK